MSWTLACPATGRRHKALALIRHYKKCGNKESSENFTIDFLDGKDWTFQMRCSTSLYLKGVQSNRSLNFEVCKIFFFCIRNTCTRSPFRYRRVEYFKKNKGMSAHLVFQAFLKIVILLHIILAH